MNWVRKIRNVIMIFLLACLVLSAGCSILLYKKNELLYSSVLKNMNKAITETDSYFEAYKYYKKAKQDIKLLLSESDSPEMANKILSGEVKISGFTLDGFQKLENYLKPLAEAERDVFSCAMIVVNSIENDDNKARTMLYMVESLADAKRIIEAVQIIKKIDKKIPKDRTLRYVAAVATELELYTQAIQAVKVMDDTYNKSNALADIAIVLGEKPGGIEEAREILDQAFEMAKTNENIFYRLFSSAYIASKYAEIGQDKVAIKILAKVFKEARTLKYNDKSKYNAKDVLSFISLQYVKIKQFSQALEVVNGIKNSESTKDHTLAMIVEKIADEAQLQRALKLINTIKTTEYKARCIIYIASKYLKDGQNDKALQLLVQALEITKEPLDIANIAIKLADINKLTQALNVAEETNDSRALGYIALKYANIAQYNQAIKIVMMIKDSEKKANLLVNIASIYVEDRQYEKAHEILAQAFEVSNEDLIDSSEDGILQEIAINLATAGYISEAVEKVKCINDQFTKVKTLTQIVDSIKLLDQAENKNRILSRAHEIIKAIQNPHEKMLALTLIREKYTEASQEEKVTALLSQMIEYVMSIDLVSAKALFLVDIAIEFDEASHELTEKDKKNLQKIVQQVYPINLFWDEQLMGNRGVTCDLPKNCHTHSQISGHKIWGNFWSFAKLKWSFGEELA
jgi:tetratricopeptide (TPR) repeat protein